MIESLSAIITFAYPMLFMIGRPLDIQATGVTNNQVILCCV